MKLHIIHLRERPDRLTLLQNELSEQNITDYEISHSIKNEDTPWIEISRAHKRIVYEAQKKHMPCILIGEDDMKFTALGGFNFFKSNIPEDYDIYLGGIIYGKINSDNTVNDFSGTMLYIIHERFYNTLLTLPEDNHIDRALKNKGRYIVCNPMVAIQHNGFSDNCLRYCNYDIYTAKRHLFGKC